MTKNIVCFASGNGTNIKAIYNFIQNNNLEIEISFIICNNSNAKIIHWAKEVNIPITLINNDFQAINSSEIELIYFLRNIQLIVLAGFLRKIPAFILELKIPIINIHPSLLPKYGGKNMYGENVHKKVLENKDSESGITIHYVNDEYDKGEIILQEKCILNNDETLNSLKQKIATLEYKNLPNVIAKLLSNQK